MNTCISMARAILTAACAAVVLSFAAHAAAPGPSGSKSCHDCHENFVGVLPTTHKPVKGADLSACLKCHEPDPSAPAEPNAFSAGLHRAHAANAVQLDCAACHVAQPEGNAAVSAGKVVLKVKEEELTTLRQAASSWMNGPYLDAIHNRADVDCAGCHGGASPIDEEVSNERCLACHGPMDALVAKTKPAIHADRNPHESHLGEIACTVCHKAHEESQVYCLDCHKKFEMTLPEKRTR